MTAGDRRWMEMALALGRRGRGTVWPNPAVGCVIVRDGRVVGRGFTQAGGRPHAEAIAIARAGPAARGATAYVSLEPCAHHGRTPPCTEALIASGVCRVVTAFEDPDPRVSGRGHAALRAAGIVVETGLCEAEATEDQRGFLSRILRGRPALTLKLASSVDGRIATGSGESRWITGPDARRVVHALRMSHDAVIVGGGTARADDPMLDIRGMGPVPQPVRIVVSGRLDLPRDGRLARTAATVPLWLVHNEGAADDNAIGAWSAHGARLLAAGSGPDGRLDPAAILSALGQTGLTRVLCEGGGALAASLLGADLVDQLVTFQAGVALGAEGVPSVGQLHLSALADATRFRLRRTEAIGGDVMSVWDRASAQRQNG